MTPNTRIDFIYLSEPDMIEASVTDMLACVDTMEEMFGLLYRGDYRMAGANSNSHGSLIHSPENSRFPNMPKPTPNRRFMALPAYLGGKFGTSGVKWYGSNIANRDRGLPRSILMFIRNDTETGAPLALMSTNLLSAYRTGAIPGVGARHLARKDSRIAGILGPGVLGKTALSAFIAACPLIDTVKVRGRGQKNIEAFTGWVRQTYPQISDLRVVETDEELVRGSDVVAYCSSGATGDPSTYPTVRRDWISPGTFFAMPALGNFDDGVIGPDVRKVLDNPAMYDAWYDEMPKPTHNSVPVGGMPVEDVAWGTVVYRNAIDRGIGVRLNLWDQPVLR